MDILNFMFHHVSKKKSLSYPLVYENNNTRKILASTLTKKGYINLLMGELNGPSSLQEVSPSTIVFSLLEYVLRILKVAQSNINTKLMTTQMKRAPSI